MIANPILLMIKWLMWYLDGIPEVYGKQWQCIRVIWLMFGMGLHYVPFDSSCAVVGHNNNCTSDILRQR